MNPEKLHFSISVGFITQHARDRYLEKGWDRAVAFLIDSLIGIDADTAASIIRGRHRLTGDVHGMDLEAEPDGVALDFDAAEADRYLGARQDGSGDWWQPYSVVVAWCRDDLNSPAVVMSRYSGWAGRMLPAPQNKTSWWGARAMAYADHPRTDRMEFVRYAGDPSRGPSTGPDNGVLFRKISGSPWWRSGARSWQEAVDRHYKRRPLREVGAGVATMLGSHKETFTEGWLESQFERSSPGLGPAMDALEYRKLGEADVERWLDDKVEAMREGGPFATPANPEDFPEGGWVLRDGVFYGCRYHQHPDLAVLLVAKKGLDGKLLELPDDEDAAGS